MSLTQPSVDVPSLLQTGFAELSEEQVAQLASLELPSPNKEAFESFLAQDSAVVPCRPSSRPHTQSDVARGASPFLRRSHVKAGETEVGKNNDTVAEQERPVTARLRRRESLPSGVAPENKVRPATSRPQTATSNLLALQRLGQDDEEELSLADHDAAYNIALSVFSKQHLVGGPEAVTEAILNTHHVELIERQLITTTAAELFLNATHLYLQNNRLSSLDGLALLTHLRVLVVHHNCVTSVRSISTLDELTYLDVSFNAMETLNPAWDLPCTSLQYLDLRNNPCCPAVVEDGEGNQADSGGEIQEYRAHVLLACANLRILDGVDCQLSDSDSGTDANSTAGRPGTQHVAAAPHPTTVQSTSASDTEKPSKLRDRLRMARLSRQTQGNGARSSPGDAPLRRAQRPTNETPATIVTSATEVGENEAQPLLPSSSLPPASCGAESGASGAVPQPQVEDTFLTKYEIVLAQVHQWRAAMTKDTASSLTDEPSLHDWRKTGSDTGVSGDPTAAMAEERADATAAQLRRSHEDLAFATAVSQRRLGQAVAEQWSTVDKVLQTRRALVQERQRRLRGVPKARSAAYQASLELLSKEGASSDLDVYRKETGS